MIGERIREGHDLRGLHHGAPHELGVREDLGGVAGACDPALRHHDDALGKVGDDLHVMADHYDGAALLGHLSHCLHDGHALAVVKTARGLVQKDHVWLHHHHRRQRHHLPLAAGEREGRLAGGQAKALDDRAGATPGLVGVGPRELEAKGHLVEDGVLADLAVGVLEEGRDVLGQEAGGGLARVEPRHAHLAGRGVQKPVQELGQRGLAGAVLTDHAHDLPGENVEGEVAHGGAGGAVREADVPEGDHGLGAADARARGVKPARVLLGSHVRAAKRPFHEVSGLADGEAGLARRDDAVLDEAVGDSSNARAVHA